MSHVVNLVKSRYWLHRMLKWRGTRQRRTRQKDQSHTIWRTASQSAMSATDEVTPGDNDLYTGSETLARLRCRVKAMWRSPPSNLVTSGCRRCVFKGALRRRSADGAWGSTGPAEIVDGLHLWVTTSPGSPSFRIYWLQLAADLLGLQFINTEEALLLLCCFIRFSMNKCLPAENEISNNFLGTISLFENVAGSRFPLHLQLGKF